MRYYNSQLNKDLGIGFGWTASFYKQLDVATSGLTVRRADGSGEPFTCPSSAGTCSGDTDTTLALAKDTAGYTLTLRNNSTERYGLTGKLLSETDPSGRITNYGYDGNGRLNTVTGPFGHTLTLGYDASGHVSTITDPISKVISYSYDANNNLVRVDYPDTTAKIYHYENTSFPNYLTGISYVDSASATTRFSTYAYDANGKAILTQHAQTDNGLPQEKFTLAYDAPAVGQTTVTDPVNMQEVMTFAVNLGVKNLVSKVNQSDSKSLTQAFDANNNLTCRKDEEGRVVTYTYNATNQRLSMTEGLAGDCNNPPSSTSVTSVTRTTGYQYVSTTLDLPTVITSPSVYTGQSKTTAIQYTDASHPNLPTVITVSGYTPAGASVARTVALGYNTSGQVSSIDGPRTDVADITTLQYNSCTTGYGCGQLSRVTNALGHITTYDSYDSNGRLLQMTDPNGLKTSYTYDPRGRVLTIQQTPLSGSFALWQYRYTVWGDVAQVIDPDGVVLNYQYDVAHYLRFIVDAAGNYVHYSYDLKGNRTVDNTYDAGGTLTRAMSYAYDLRNHLSSMNLAGNVSQLVYDAVGNLTQETDPNNHVTSHTPDALNRLLRTVDALSGVTGYGYDINDRPTVVTAPNNLSTQYSYDDLGNLLQEVSPDRNATMYSYDTAGNVKTVTDANNRVTTYTYDALNRVATQQSTNTNTPSYTYGYDSCGAGRLCYISSKGNALLFSYEGWGRLVSQTDTRTGSIAYGYTRAGRLNEIDYPSGSTVQYQYDTVGRVSQVSATLTNGAPTLASGIQYYPFGPVSNFNFGNGETYSATFNRAYRPKLRSDGSYLEAIGSFDGNGNILQRYISGTESFTYDALDRLVSAANLSSGRYGSLSYLYDPNGNRRSETRNGTTTPYSYDPPESNSLYYVGSTELRLRDAVGATIYATSFGTLKYDGYGRMTAAVTAGAAYAYNALNQRTQKSLGSTTTAYAYGPQGELLYETTGTSTQDYVYLHGVPLARIDNGSTVYYYHNDHLGAPQLMTDSSGNTVWQASYEPFGWATVTVSTITNNLRLAGQYFDQETGLYYNWHRYYDPRVGRYITSDPIGLAGGLNTYGYVYQNPLRYTDSSGLCPFCPLIPPLLSLGLAAYSMAVDPVPFLGRGFSGQAETLAERTATAAAKDTTKSCPTTATGLPDKLYHYTRSAEASRILENGLVPGARSGKIFTTPTGNYSPIEAQMFLALPPNRGLSGTIFEIDVTALRKMGVLPTAGPLRVLPTSNAMGSGSEFIFEQAIPSSVMRQVR